MKVFVRDVPMQKHVQKKNVFQQKRAIESLLFFSLLIDEQQLVGMEFQCHFHQEVL